MTQEWFYENMPSEIAWKEADMIILDSPNSTSIPVKVLAGGRTYVLLSPVSLGFLARKFKSADRSIVDLIDRIVTALYNQ